jgi:hypothetical protein
MFVRSGYTPWRRPSGPAMIGNMDNKTWFIEVALVTCLLAASMVAFSLMVGQSLWKVMAGK